MLGGGLQIADGVGKFKGAPVDATGNARATLVQLLGVLVDWFPSPTEGWHIGSQVGLGGIAVTDSLRDSSSVAFTGSLFGGYDWWIGPEWSLGMLLSLSSGTSEALKQSNGDATGYSFTPLAFGVEATILWH